MTNYLEKYNFYGVIIRRLVLFTGLWPIVSPIIFYRLLPFVHGLTAILMCSALFNFCFDHSTNLNVLLKGLGLGLSYLTVIQKLTCFTIYRKQLLELHTTLELTFGQDFHDTELRPILLSPLLWFYRPSLSFLVMAWTTTVLWWITPIISIFMQLSREVDAVKYHLPYPASYPWRIEGNIFLYTCHYIFEVYASLCIGSITTAVDSLFGYYIFQICGQLRTLSHRMRNLSSRESYQKVLSECVTRHKTLMRCQDHLEQIYGPIVLWLLVTSAIVMCSQIYQASHMSPGKAAPVAIYIAMKLMQTLHYGWFGTALTMENDKFREATYASDWSGSGEKRLMTNILLMMTYKPPVLSACSISTISIDMFVAVCNTAMSYFFMLRTLEEGNKS